MMNAKRKIVRSTNAQIRLLVDYMSSNQSFAADEIIGPLCEQHQEKWDRLADLLADVGPRKTVDQLKNTWTDLKIKARQEGERARLVLEDTGDTATIPCISRNTKKILDAIGQQYATGIGSEEDTDMGDFLDVKIMPPPGFIPEKDSRDWPSSSWVDPKPSKPWVTRRPISSPTSSEPSSSCVAPGTSCSYSRGMSSRPIRRIRQRRASINHSAQIVQAQNETTRALQEIRDEIRLFRLAFERSLEK